MLYWIFIDTYHCHKSLDERTYTQVSLRDTRAGESRLGKCRLTPLPLANDHHILSLVVFTMESSPQSLLDALPLARRLYKKHHDKTITPPDRVVKSLLSLAIVAVRLACDLEEDESADTVRLYQSTRDDLEKFGLSHVDGALEGAYSGLMASGAYNT